MSIAFDEGGVYKLEGGVLFDEFEHVLVFFLKTTAGNI